MDVTFLVKDDQGHSFHIKPCEYVVHAHRVRQDYDLDALVSETLLRVRGRTWVLVRDEINGASLESGYIPDSIFVYGSFELLSDEQAAQWLIDMGEELPPELRAVMLGPSLVDHLASNGKMLPDGIQPCPVELVSDGKIVLRGDEKDITPQRYDCIRLLVEVYPEGFTVKELREKLPDVSAPDRQLRGLKEDDSDWEHVLLSPGKNTRGGKWRLSHPSNPSP
jgi:hypothetical protein